MLRHPIKDSGMDGSQESVGSHVDLVFRGGDSLGDGIMKVERSIQDDEVGYFR